MDASLRRSEDGRLTVGDWILVLGIVLAPMTSLRIPGLKIGPGEFLVFLWALWQLLQGRSSSRGNLLLYFWLPFLYITLVGTTVGWGLAPEQLSVPSLLTWAYLAFVSSVIYAGLRVRNGQLLERLLRRIGMLGALTYGSLLLAANLGISNLFGQTLWYGPRFSPLAPNPHQTALFAAVLLFINLRAAVFARGLWPRISYVGAATISLVVELATNSATGVLSIVGTGVCLPLLYAWRQVKDTRTRVALAFTTGAACVGIVLVAESRLLSGIRGFIESDANGEGRLRLLALVRSSVQKSPIFGLGPGEHAQSDTGMMEFHNTYAEILVMAGILGFSVFMVFTLVALRRLMVDPTLVTIILPLLGYGMGGFAARRLPYWAMTALLLALAYAFQRGSDTRARDDHADVLAA